MHFPEEKIITKPEFEMYLKSKEWTFDCGVWRSKDCHEMTSLQSMKSSLDIVAAYEKRTTGEVWLDIMSNPLEGNK